MPTTYPTVSQSDFPSTAPTLIPSGIPSYEPSRRPSQGPSALPTIYPSVKPSVFPTMEPTYGCVDSSLRLRVITSSTEAVLRRCSWVTQKHTRYRCTLTGVAAACPITCGTCANCVDPILQFKLSYNNNTVEFNCDLIASASDDKLQKMCTASGNICRKACGIC